MTSEDQNNFESHETLPITEQDLAGNQGPLSSTRLGPFKLLSRVGTGAQGEVWLADQTEPVKRRLALKLLRSDRDSKNFLARFEGERQALAMMDHANIAKFFDAGVIGDSPYFAMEYCEGAIITAYCDENRLSLDERLRLFVAICQGVQHAHQKGIIHRDLKPQNILVAMRDGVAVPKIIDFGLAKATQPELRLSDNTIFTEIGGLVGTYKYMSPEQAGKNPHDVDTRSDIYSLGVILYELLTGSTPLDASSIHGQTPDAVIRAIREDEPQRPSTLIASSTTTINAITSKRQIQPAHLQQVLRGELDWIVMKTLEKDRVRRYPTALALASEIERYLNNEAVEARPPSLGYRLSKIVAKHKAALLTATTAVAILIGGLITMSSLWYQARAAEIRRLDTEVEMAERGGQYQYAASLLQLIAQRRELDIDEQLRHVQLLLAGSNAESAKVLQRIDRQLLSPEHTALLELLAGEAGLLSKADPLDSFELIRSALRRNQLSPRDTAYARALVADSSQQCLAEFTTCLELDPLHASARAKRGMTNLFVGQISDAEEDGLIGKAWFPDDMRFPILLASVYSSQGKSAEAAEQLELIKDPAIRSLQTQAIQKIASANRAFEEFNLDPSSGANMGPLLYELLQGIGLTSQGESNFGMPTTPFTLRADQLIARLAPVLNQFDIPITAPELDVLPELRKEITHHQLLDFTAGLSEFGRGSGWEVARPLMEAAAQDDPIVERIATAAEWWSLLIWEATTGKSTELRIRNQPQFVKAEQRLLLRLERDGLPNSGPFPPQTAYAVLVKNAFYGHADQLVDAQLAREDLAEEERARWQRNKQALVEICEHHFEYVTEKLKQPKE